MRSVRRQAQRCEPGLPVAIPERVPSPQTLTESDRLQPALHPRSHSDPLISVEKERTHADPAARSTAARSSETDLRRATSVVGPHRVDHSSDDASPPSGSSRDAHLAGRQFLIPPSTAGTIPGPRGFDAASTGPGARHRTHGLCRFVLECLLANFAGLAIQHRNRLLGRSNRSLLIRISARREADAVMKSL